MPTNEDVALETINTIAEKLSKEEDRELLKSMVTVVLNKYESAIAALRAAEAGAIVRTLTAAAEWHDARYVELRDNPDGRFGLVSGISGARMHEHRESAEHFRALASPSAMAMQREVGVVEAYVSGPLPDCMMPDGAWRENDNQYSRPFDRIGPEIPSPPASEGTKL
jgi:hypothetical protein